MRGRPNVRDLLVALLIERAGPGTMAMHGQSRAWASATFAGARHCFTLSLPQSAVAPFEEGLSETQFALRGHLLADIAIVARHEEGARVSIAIEALTIEED